VLVKKALNIVVNASSDNNAGLFVQAKNLVVAGDIKASNGIFFILTTKYMHLLSNTILFNKQAAS